MKTRGKLKSCFIRITVIALAVAILSGCTPGKNNKSKRLRDSDDSPSFDEFPEPVPTYTPPLPPESGPATPRPDTPPITFRVDGVGYDEEIEIGPVPVNKILKIAFTPGIQNEPVGEVDGQYYGYVPAYSAMGVYIKVGSSSKPTQFVSNGLYDGNAQTSSAIDFSNSFSRLCDRTDTDCRQEVMITIHRPNYNFDCLNFGIGCPWTHVRENHAWNGTIIVETDDTAPIEQ